MDNLTPTTLGGNAKSIQRIQPPSIVERLKSKLETITAQKELIESAIKAIEENPAIETVMNCIQEVGLGY